jgi:hypothetical protein
MATPLEDFRSAAAAMEQALADALSMAVSVAGTGSTDGLEAIEKLLKLIIKKEIVLELLLEEFHNS